MKPVIIVIFQIFIHLELLHKDISSLYFIVMIVPHSWRELGVQSLSWKLLESRLQQLMISRNLQRFPETFSVLSLDQRRQKTG